MVNKKNNIVLVCTDIVWDTDGEDVLELPNNVVITNPTDKMLEDCEKYNNVIDYLSDKYGFCIENCYIYKCYKINAKGD